MRPATPALSAASQDRLSVFFDEVRKASARSRQGTVSRSDTTRSGWKEVSDAKYHLATRRSATGGRSSSAVPNQQPFEVIIRLFTAERGSTPSHLPPDQKFFWDLDEIVESYSIWLSQIYSIHQAWEERTKLKFDTEPLLDNPNAVRKVSLSALHKVSYLFIVFTF